MTIPYYTILDWVALIKGCSKDVRDRTKYAPKA